MDERYCDACGKWYPNNKYYFYEKRHDRRCKTCQERKIRSSKSNYAKARGIEFDLTEPRCGVCDKPTRKRKQGRGKATTFLCDTHAPQEAGKGIDRSTCDSCDWIEWCKIRVRSKLWVLCERPTLDELECNHRLGLGDGALRPNVIGRRYERQPNNISDNS